MRILVVEDNDSLRTALAGYLAQLGHEVKTAAAGRQAVELAETFGPALLVCDWHLGDGTDGVSVARAIRRQHADVALIFITGDSVDALRRETGDLDLTVHLTKPVHPASIVAAANALHCDAP